MNTKDPSMGEYLRAARTAWYIYGGITHNESAFTCSQNAPQGEQNLGYKTCVNITPSYPILRLSR